MDMMQTRCEIPAPGSLLVSMDAVSVHRGGRALVSGVNFVLRAGEHWAVTGENGSGKSTFLRLVRGDLWPDQGATGGTRHFYVDGQPSHSPVGMRHRVGLAGADLRDYYRHREWNMSVTSAVASGLSDAPRYYGPWNASVEERVHRALTRVGMEAFAQTGLEILSQGELVKVLLARALVTDPIVLILDEVDDGLDEMSRRDVLRVVEMLAQGGTTILAVSHHRESRPDFLHREIRFEMGKVAFCGDVPQGTHGGSSSLPLATDVTCENREVQRTDTPLIVLHKVQVHIDEQVILEDIDWQLFPEENWAILGRNGAGKSTFLKLVAGEIHAEANPETVVSRFGYSSLPLSMLRRQIGMVSYTIQAGFDDDDPALAVTATGVRGDLALHVRPDDHHFEAAESLLDRLGLIRLAGCRMGELSQGERRKIILCRALLSSPRVLCLDEPLGGLDTFSKRTFLDLLEALDPQQTNLVFISHHQRDLPATLTHAVFLDQGRIVKQGRL
ncbi:ATP-binding cassette domain-containing protein [Desulfovibrio inopinatus]|uniref:ATP-binding cassette domain-containing protein n=1 Tax=Desulfovibrio inopinatus TaxID=102109 RepID=UPI000401266C|nr:ATP-binding cassette domain-containing protein [Desulfovibrio inopinatus]